MEVLYGVDGLGATEEAGPPGPPQTESLSLCLRLRRLNLQHSASSARIIACYARGTSEADYEEATAAKLRRAEADLAMRKRELTREADTADTGPAGP